MPNKSTVERAKEDMREGKSASTAAGEFVREEIEHVREGKHGARSPQQAVAIGLSKARRAGIPLKPPRAGKASEETRKSAERDYEKGQAGDGASHSARRSQAREEALEREPRSTASHRSLSSASRRASRRRTKSERSTAARNAVRTKGEEGMRRAGEKAARTRRRNG
jgi:hypothetical protein